jgi:small GTP-binding protein
MSTIDRKIVVLGDSGVGKTALVQRYVNGRFAEEYRPTTGAQPLRKVLERDGDTVRLVIWDVAGHLLRLHPAYSSEADGVILVCDMSKVSSAEVLIKWLNRVREHLGDAPFVLAANKSDIAEFHEECRGQLPKDITIVITSAKTGNNVDQLFDEMLAKIV